MPSNAAFRDRLLNAARHPNNRQTASAFAIKLIGAVASFAFSFILARTYGAAGTGGYALALTTATIASTVSLFGLDFILLRTVAGDVRVNDTATAGGTVRTVTLGVLGLASVIAIALALVGIPLLARLLDDGRGAGVLPMAAFAVLPLALTRIAAMSLRGAGKVATAQLFDGPMAIMLTLAGLGVLVMTGALGDVRRVFLLYIVGSGLAALIAWAIFRRASRRWAPPARVPLLPMLARSWKVSVAVLSMIAADWLILLMLGASFSRTEVGQFRTAWQITALITLVVATYDTVAGPRIAAAHRVGDTRGIRAIWRQSVLVMMAGSLPLMVIALVFPGWVLGLFGPEFVVASTTLRILALGQLVNIVTGSVGATLMMTGRETSSLLTSLAGLTALTLTGLVLIPRFGIEGAAIATAAGVTVRNSAMTVIVFRMLRGHPA